MDEISFQTEVYDELFSSIIQFVLSLRIVIEHDVAWSLRVIRHKHSGWHVLVQLFLGKSNHVSSEVIVVFILVVRYVGNSLQIVLVSGNWLLLFLN